MEAVPGAGELVARHVELIRDWTVSRAHGTAEQHHSSDVTSWVRRVVLLEHSDTAVVLGSTQSIDDINLDAARSHGISVVRRRSGGGAVFLRPLESVWIDVMISRSDPLWDDDVSASSLWLGDAWAHSLRELGRHDLNVHRGAMAKTSFSRTICFDGLAPGEVTCGGRKVVGISQRRTRDGARFQCVVYRSWNVEQWRDCLASPDAREILDALAVETVPFSGDEILTAFSQHLPTF